MARISAVVFLVGTTELHCGTDLRDVIDFDVHIPEVCATIMAESVGTTELL